MTVSVIIPAYNQRRFIEDALQSVLRQDWPVHEVVIVDDASTDGNYRELEALDPRVRILETTHGGVSRARNIGAASVDSEFVAFLDADDVWLPGLLGRQIRHLQRHPDAAAVFSQCLHWYPNETLGNGHQVPDDFSIPQDGECMARRLSYLEVLSTPGLPGHMCTLLIRRHHFLALGGFAEDRHYGEDIEFAIRISQALRLDLFECPGMLYRRHSKSATAQFQDPNHLADLVKDVVARYGLSDGMGATLAPATVNKALARAHFDHGYLHFWIDSRAIARRELWRSVSNHFRLRTSLYLLAALTPGGRELLSAAKRWYLGRDL